MFVSTHAYTHSIPELQDALIWPNATMWGGWLEYFKLAIPSVGIVWTAYMAYHLQAFIAVDLGQEAQE